MTLTIPPRQMPTPAALARHWVGWCLKCDCRFMDCTDGADHYIPIYDSGEPNCMRCGRFLGYTTNALFYKEVTTDERVSCQRAHIISRYLVYSGTVGPDELKIEDIDAEFNIVLLCHGCHFYDPEPHTRREYLNWLCAERDRQRTAKIALAEYGKSHSYLDDPAISSLMQSCLPDTIRDPGQVVADMIRDLKDWQDR